MNDEQNHEVTGKFWVAPLLALTLLLCLALSPLGKTSPEEKVVRARAKAEVLAYQVAQLFRENSLNGMNANAPSSSVSGRAPAAINPPGPVEGLMGQDPWGHAFTYKIIPEGEKLRVEMRSAGPNGFPDQQPAGDDIVLTLSL